MAAALRRHDGRAGSASSWATPPMPRPLARAQACPGERPWNWPLGPL